MKEKLKMWSVDLNQIVTGEMQAELAAERMRAAVNIERDRRIAGGFVFAGVAYQTGPNDRENIAGASTAALAAIVNGAQVGDYLWHGGALPFVWIAGDNSENPMDAQTMFAFGQAAMAHKQAHIFAARALKNMDPIPSDFADDSYWQ